MTQDMHERARELAMAGRIEEIAGHDRQWLDSHLADCGECARFANSLDTAIGALRLPAVMADSLLVRATQSRVRHRAFQLQTTTATMRPLWIAAAMVCAWATVTT